jgi:hypothetical protein
MARWQSSHFLFDHPMYIFITKYFQQIFCGNRDNLSEQISSQSLEPRLKFSAEASTHAYNRTPLSKKNNPKIMALYLNRKKDIVAPFYPRHRAWGTLKLEYFNCEWFS